MKILYVEDEPNLREEVAFILEMENFEIISAENGQQALGYIESESPDLILTDLKMPVMGGEELLDEVIRLGYSNIPVIVMSAFVVKEWTDRLIEKGAKAYFSKPFSIDELVSKIRSFELAG